ncbi:diacylglycerol kinase accessory domain domain-containing protein [Cyclospora cayetanensis]|uniref:Diacylglycerol kinase n=1 Tax=Cyclospora cayetanensis TaxID=88456 RepID=A0A1D3D966_9EIME|nr:diacylglycerol kinase accessory domain domain-containing protein [Cyclospora cayetanensis]
MLLATQGPEGPQVSREFSATQSNANPAKQAPHIEGSGGNVAAEIGSGPSAASEMTHSGGPNSKDAPLQEVWASPDEAWTQQPSGTLKPPQVRFTSSVAAKHSEAEAGVEATAPETVAAAREAPTSPASAVQLGPTAALEDFDEDSDFHYVFIFTNPSSGGNKASAFTRTGVSRLTLTEPYSAKIFIYDIREGPSGGKPGFLLLKAISARKGVHGDLRPSSAAEKDTIRILVAGGDGTVMWCLDEMKITGVDSEVCAVGVVPYGTGNDFANVFGWRPFNAANPFDASLNTLRKLVDCCMQASVVYHDLWHEVVERGRQEVKELRFTMSNYFSMGVESRIGRGFDRHRTKSRTLNKMRYGIEGLKKTLMTFTKSINQIIVGLKVNPGTPEEKVLFTTDKAVAEQQQIPLLKKTASLVVLNIPSFSGGNDIWGPSKKLALIMPNKQAQLEAKLKQEFFIALVSRRCVCLSGAVAKELLKVPQQMGDKNLEFVTFESVPSMGMEFLLHGRGSRLHSGEGPWEISFRPLDDKTRVYFQTDGEFFQLTQPSSVTLSHDRRVRVLTLKPQGVEERVLAISIHTRIMEASLHGDPLQFNLCGMLLDCDC